MKLIMSKGVLLLLSFPLFLFSSTASFPLANYPIRQIDRPYTMPKSMRAWRTSLQAGIGDNSEEVLPLNPFNLEQALSDRVTLLWSVLPVGIKYQFLNTGSSLLGGFAVLSGIGYYSSGGVIVVPETGLFYRYKIIDILALELGAFFKENMRLGDSEFIWEAGTSISPMVQLNDDLAIWISVSAIDTRAYKKVNQGGVTSDQFFTQKNNTRYNDRQLVYPVGIKSALSISKQWELITGYNYIGLFSKNIKVNHLIYGNVFHYW